MNLNTLLLLALLTAMVYLWALSIKRQVVKHDQYRRNRQPKFKEPHTPADGVVARH